MKKKGDHGPAELRDCPLPRDESQKLITHKIDAGLCGFRQSRNYHKCFCCKWRGLDATAEKAAAAGGH